MGGTSLRCRIGLHAWVRVHPPDERRQQGAEHWVCVACRKQRRSGSIPMGLLGG